jgi:catalase
MSDQIPNVFDFQLYEPAEQWKGGDAAAECREFVQLAERVLRVQRHHAAQSDGVPRRVFHAKSHGAILGSLIPLGERPPETRHGLFRDEAPESYPVLARFSNGQGIAHVDALPDVRGVALKIFGASSTSSAKTVDLLLINGPGAFGRDHAEFVDFMEATQDGLPSPAWSIAHKELMVNLLRCLFVPAVSVIGLRYWGAHAYLLGTHQSMRINVKPAADGSSLLEHTLEILHQIGDRDFLRHDLKSRAQQHRIMFEFCVQLERKDKPELTPIENTLIDWKEGDSPSIPVAHLIFEAQKVSDERREYVDTLPFTPANYIPEHRPLGNLARGRLFSYLASQRGRLAAPNPTYEEFMTQWNCL